MTQRPNVLIILADDMGYSDLGCYGGEISTPNIDRIASEGTRYRNFYASPRCSPSRASLLTGLHPHETGIGILTDDNSPDGYTGNLNDQCATIAEVLRSAGYRTAARGKWHLSNDTASPNGAWPTERGFESYWGTLTGCGDFYAPGTLTRGTEPVDVNSLPADFHYTDATAAECVEFVEQWAAERDSSPETSSPFMLYAAFTAPHWPLHARSETIAKYRGTYDEGWGVVRERRFERQRELGIVDSEVELGPADLSVPQWDSELYPEWQATRMEAYAAQVEELDTAIGRMLDELEEQSALENTIVIFLSDNGASDEALPLYPLETFMRRTDIVNEFTRGGDKIKVGNIPGVRPGGPDTYQSYGRGWANVSNTPFRLYKLWTHEGGVSTPFIVRWPEGGVRVNEISSDRFQLTSVMPTLIEACDAQYPATRHGVGVRPCTAPSMVNSWKGETGEETLLWWEHCGSGAVIDGPWKLVRQWGSDWELYNLTGDPLELDDRATVDPERVTELTTTWQGLCDTNGVIPFETTMRIYRERGLGWNEAKG